MNSYTDFLYPTPSAVEGAGRILDFADQMTAYNTSTTPEEADMTAIALDWATVGNDLRRALTVFAATHPLPSPDVQHR